MKCLIILTCCLLVAAVTNANEDADVIKYESVVNPDSFKTELELSNSIKSYQEGHLSGDALVEQGSYSFVSPKGVPVKVEYKADENGYQVVKAQPPLPTPAPIPDYILRSIRYIEQHPVPNKA